MILLYNLEMCYVFILLIFFVVLDSKHKLEINTNIFDAEKYALEHNWSQNDWDNFYSGEFTDPNATSARKKQKVS